MFVQTFGPDGLPTNKADGSVAMTVESITAEEYHAMPGVSNSRLSDFIEMDADEYWFKYFSGQYKAEQKDHFDFGTAVHDVCLLDDRSRIVLIPKDVLTKDGKRFGGAWNDFVCENSGKLLFKQAEHDAVMACVDAVMAHPIAGELLRAPGPREKLFQYHDDQRGLLMRTRPDKISYWCGKTIVPDIKTATDVSVGTFNKTIADRGYHRQKYFYSKVLANCPEQIQVDDFVFITVRSKPPHLVRCFLIDDAFDEIAKSEVETALDDLAERTRSNNWSMPSLMRLSPPNYLRSKKEYQQ